MVNAKPCILNDEAAIRGLQRRKAANIKGLEEVEGARRYAEGDD